MGEAKSRMQHAEFMLQVAELNVALGHGKEAIANVREALRWRPMDKLAPLMSAELKAMWDYQDSDHLRQLEAEARGWDTVGGEDS